MVGEGASVIVASSSLPTSLAAAAVANRRYRKDIILTAMFLALDILELIKLFLM